jgi:hypothetical protein
MLYEIRGLQHRYSVTGRPDDLNNFKYPNIISVLFTGQVYSSGQFFTDSNKSIIRGTIPTLYFRDTERAHRSGMIHINDSRIYFLSGGIDSEAWGKTANIRYPLYLQTNTNAAVFGGDIDASSGTIESKNTTVSNGDSS